jgi:hypothetical protein
MSQTLPTVSLRQQVRSGQRTVRPIGACYEGCLAYSNVSILRRLTEAYLALDM